MAFGAVVVTRLDRRVAGTSTFPPRPPDTEVDMAFGAQSS